MYSNQKHNKSRTLCSHAIGSVWIAYWAVQVVLNHSSLIHHPLSPKCTILVSFQVSHRSQGDTSNVMKVTGLTNLTEVSSSQVIRAYPCPIWDIYLNSTSYKKKKGIWNTFPQQHTAGRDIFHTFFSHDVGLYEVLVFSRRVTCSRSPSALRPCDEAERRDLYFCEQDQQQGVF